MMNDTMRLYDLITLAVCRLEKAATDLAFSQERETGRPGETAAEQKELRLARRNLFTLIRKLNK